MRVAWSRRHENRGFFEKGCDSPTHRMAAAQAERVCRAWHRTDEVKVFVPGLRRAGGWEKGKGVIARWGLEEAQSKSAGRPCMEAHCRVVSRWLGCLWFGRYDRRRQKRRERENDQESCAQN